MHFGIFMEFGSRPALSEAESFQEGFRLVDARGNGLDGVWLAELHFNPRALSAVVAHRSCQFHRHAHPTPAYRHGRSCAPPEHPLRIAEEVATVDQISEGRFEFGVGRSGFARSYDLYGFPTLKAGSVFVKRWTSSSKPGRANPSPITATFTALRAP